MADRSIRPMTQSDWPVVARIYQQGIETGNATLETEAPDWAEWNSHHLEVCRLVAEVDDEVVAWVALSQVSSRDVYRGVAESSIYVSPDAAGQGIGTELLTALVDASENAGFWTLQTAIFPENAPSIALHERCGFRVVGTRSRIGSHHGMWRDTVLMERRSERVGL